MRWTLGSAILFIVTVCPVQIADAQTYPQISVTARAGYYLLPNWSKTYDVIYENDGEMMLGADVALKLSRYWEVGVTVDRVKGEGERVWPNENGGWKKTGEKITFELRPITVQLRRSLPLQFPVAPYFGLGLGYCTFQETRGTREGGFGFLALAGAEWSISDFFSLLLETEYSSYPDVIGTGDLSHYFGEKDIGGLSLRLSARYSFSLGV